MLFLHQRVYFLINSFDSLVDLSFFLSVENESGVLVRCFISGLWRLWKCTDVRLQYLHQSRRDSVRARCRIRGLTRGQVSAEAGSLRLLFRRLAWLLLASPCALLFPVLGPKLLFVSVSCLLVVVIWIMSALFVIYLFIFSIGTCFRFDWHEDTFAWLMVQLFFMGVLSSAHLFGEAEGSLNSIKLDTLWSELFVCVCVCLCSILKSFFLSLERVWQGWLHLWSLMKLKLCKRGLYEMYTLN